MYERFKGDLEEASKNKSISRSWTKEKRQGHDAYVEVNPIQSKQFHHGKPRVCREPDTHGKSRFTLNKEFAVSGS
jgi:hypothetical protein